MMKNLIQKASARTVLAEEGFKKNKQSGFTLLEILLVVAAIGILAGIVILALNPARQLGATRDAERRVDVNTILNATYQYIIDNNGLPASITSTSTEICRTNAVSCSGFIDLSVLTTQEKYLISIPVDPSNTSVNGTGYFIKATANGRITIEAPDNETEGDIIVTR